METDPAAGVGVLAALAAGMVSFLSPCVLPLVPGYLSAVAGLDPDEIEHAGWRRVIGPSLLFIAAFWAIFIVLGLTATGIGEALRDNRGCSTRWPARSSSLWGCCSWPACSLPG